MKKKATSSTDNMAELQHGIKNNCDCCNLPLIFQMRDKYHEFSLDLGTILRCLRVAENEGVIPALSDDFWVGIEVAYHLKIK